MRIFGDSVRRRTLLQGIGLAALTSAPNQSAAEGDNARLRSMPVLDVHAHFFNAADLPIKNFLANAFLHVERKEFTIIAPILMPLLSIMEAIMKAGVLSAQSESQAIIPGKAFAVAGITAAGSEKLSETDPSAKAAVTEALGSFLEFGKQSPPMIHGLMAAPETSVDATLMRLRARQESVKGTTIEDPHATLVQLLIEQFAPQFKASPSGVLEDPKDKVAAAMADSILTERPDDDGTSISTLAEIVGRHIKWASLLRSRRLEIYREYIRVYGGGTSTGAYVAASTALLVDYEYWLRPEINAAGDHDDGIYLDHQVTLLEQMALSRPGEILPFVPFDPARQVFDVARKRSRTALERVKDAIKKKGFVGVKLYPPMGFLPANNAAIENLCKYLPCAELFPRPLVEAYWNITPQKDRKADKISTFGAALDAELWNLFEFCSTESVPIMVHCAPTFGSRSGYEIRAYPGYWKPVLERFPTLKVCFGHFGDVPKWKEVDEPCKLNADPNETIDTEGRWSYAIANLMDQYDNIYTDLSYYSPLLLRQPDGILAWLISWFCPSDDAPEVKRLIELLRVKFLSQPNRSRRILYGSDWLLLARERRQVRYLENFTGEFGEYFTADQVTAIMSGNSLNFLGLQKGVPTYQRLAGYFDAHNKGQSFAAAVNLFSSQPS